MPAALVPMLPATASVFLCWCSSPSVCWCMAILQCCLDVVHPPFPAWRSGCPASLCCIRATPWQSAGQLTWCYGCLQALLSERASMARSCVGAAVLSNASWLPFLHSAEAPVHGWAMPGMRAPALARAAAAAARIHACAPPCSGLAAAAVSCSCLRVRAPHPCLPLRRGSCFTGVPRPAPVAPTCISTTSQPGRQWIRIERAVLC